MREALYHPVRGYYAQRVEIGKFGDFSTTSTLSPILGEAVAAWIRSRYEELIGGGPCAVVELGPGNGALLGEVMRRLCHGKMDTKEGAGVLSFIAVESSPRLRSVLHDKFGDRIQIFDTLSDALAACGGNALIYSNEFPDAFPAVQLRYVGGDWQEIFVDVKSDALSEISQPLTRGIDADAPNRVRPGQRLFIHPSYHQYLRENLAGFQQGAMLTIDYGRAYPSGECRAYGEHQRYEGLDVYQYMGERDITCDVNFTDLKRWGEQLGLATTSLQTQAEFFEEHITGLAERAKDDEAVAFLTNPLGAGGAFMCLEQRVAPAGRDFVEAK